MPDSTKTKLISAICMLLAAIIFASSLIWYGLRAIPTQSSAQLQSSVERPTPPKLAPGVPNPADALPRITMQSVSGKVLSVGAQTIVVQPSGIQPETLGANGDGVGQQVVVRIDKKTDIYKEGASKDPSAYAAQMAQFRAIIRYASSTDIFVAPDSFEHIPLKLTDIVPGEYVMALISASDPGYAASVSVTNLSAGAQTTK